MYNSNSRTLYYERWRAISMGLLEVGQGSILLLIAVRVLHASGTEKGFLVMGSSIGHLLSPSSVGLFARRGMSPSRGASMTFLCVAMCLAVAAASSSAAIFVFAGMSAGALSSATSPLITQMYQESYHERERGKLFATIATVRILVAIIASWLLGWILDQGNENSGYILFILITAALFSSGCLARCVTAPLTHDGGRFSLLPDFSPVRDDRLFRTTLISWMFLGFGNLMMVPLRVEYLANPRYGFDLSAEQVMLIATATPNLIRLTLNRTFGRIFDAFGFLKLRIVLNICMALGTASFFISGDMAGLLIGSVLLGISFAGSDVLWALWVTKVAPPHKVAHYMSIHTFLTGVRGVIAPFLGFHLAETYGIATTGLVSMLLMGFSVLLLLPDGLLGSKDTR